MTHEAHHDFLEARAGRGGHLFQRGVSNCVFVDGSYVLTQEALTLYGFAVDLDFPNVGPTSGTMAAPRHQIDEPDLVHLAQIGLIDEVTFGQNLVHIDAEPANVGE